SAAHEASHDRRIDDALALDHALQCVDEDADIGNALLEEVAQSARLIGEQAFRITWLEILAEKHDRGARMLGPNAVCRCDSLISVGRRHPDIDDGRIRLEARYQSQERLAIAGLTDNLDARVV